MLKIIFTLCLLLSSSITYASNFGLIGGFRQNDASLRAPSVSTIDGELSFQFGGLFLMDFTEQLLFRTGVIYTQRKVEVNSTSTETEFNYNYLDLPANVQMTINDRLSIYGGVNIGLFLNASCTITNSASTCSTTDEEVLIFQPNIGASLNINEDMMIEIFYEFGIGDVDNIFEKLSAFGVNYTFMTY